MKKTIRHLQLKGYGVTIALGIRNRATNSFFRFFESPDRHSIFENRFSISTTDNRISDYPDWYVGSLQSVSYRHQSLQRK